MFHLAQFRAERPKEKPSFIRRMTTFNRGSPNRPRMAFADVAFIGTALGGGLNHVVNGEGKERLMRKHCHESVRRHTERIYDDLRGKDRRLSREKLLDFLRQTQGVAEVEPLQADSYSFQEFLYIWLNHDDAWGAVRSLRSDEDDETKPMSNYFISSSHNTYLEGNQLLSRSSAEAYTAVSPAVVSVMDLC